MDKFIQLPVIVPQLSSDQVDNYVNHLLSDTDVSQEQYDIEKENIRNLKKTIEDKEMSASETVVEVGKIEVSENHPELKQELAGIVMSSKAKELKDNDPEMIKELQGLKSYLSDNPRTIKRVVNVYRFHRVLSDGWRETEESYFLSALPKQIARWTIVIVRWPHFVRFIQRHGRKIIGTGSTTYLEKVISLADGSNGVDNWGAKLAKAGLVKSNGQAGKVDESVSGAGWVDDSDLFRFLKEDSKLSDDEHKLPKATEYGMW